LRYQTCLKWVTFALAISDQEHSGTFLATPEKLEGNFSWIYILNRKIEGAILPTKLKREDQNW